MDRILGLLDSARLLALAVGGAAALYDIAKPLIGRMRPPASLQYGAPETDWAFPSGHATQSASFYAMLAVVLTAYVWPRRGGWLTAAAAAVVFLVALTRLYIGIHWLTDVVGGLALGFAWFATLRALSLRAADSSPSAS